MFKVFLVVLLFVEVSQPLQIINKKSKLADKWSTLTGCEWCFYEFYFSHSLKTIIREKTAVRAENAAFCNHISIYAIIKLFGQELIKNFSCVIFQRKSFQKKPAETKFDVFQFGLYVLSWIQEQ